MNRIVLETIRTAVNLVLPFYWAAAHLRYQLARARGEDVKTLEKLKERCSRFRSMLFGYGQPQFKDISELYNSPDQAFEHYHTPPGLGLPSGMRVQDVIIVDNFYEDPDAVRRYALELEYVPYAVNRGEPFWYSSALEVKENPLKGKGVRLANDQIKQRLAEIIRSPIDDKTWETAGDGWNGAFHYKLRSPFPGATSQIHNHAGRDSDVSEGWSGLVYLTKGPKSSAGTSIWRHKETGMCYSHDSVYTLNHDEFELVMDVENRYNRLVLFYASIFHVGEEGFGNCIEIARLFQTFFFNVL